MSFLLKQNFSKILKFELREYVILIPKSIIISKIFRNFQIMKSSPKASQHNFAHLEKILDQSEIQVEHTLSDPLQESGHMFL